MQASGVLELAHSGLYEQSVNIQEILKQVFQPFLAWNEPQR